MEGMTLGEVVLGTGGDWVGEERLKEEIIRGISVDSRTVGHGEVFFALKGPHFDGHHFALEALEKGAMAVVIRRDFPQRVREGRAILVLDPLKSFGDLARSYYENFSPPIVAITGSNGKTTTKEMTARILSTRYEVLKSEKSFNNFVGVPLTLSHLRKAHNAVVLEFGTSERGEMKRLCEIAPPRVGVITQIAETHLEFLGSIEGVREEKAVLLQHLNLLDHAVLNGDDPSTSYLKQKTRAKVVTFSIQGKGDLNADEIRVEGGLTRFRVNGKYPFEIFLLGKFNVMNALAALAVGRILEVHFEEAREVLRTFPPTPMRMEVTPLGDLTLLNDTYNSNPASVREALQVLAQVPGNRKIAILGDMLELGERGPECHWKVGEAAAKMGINLLVAFGPLSKNMMDGANSGGLKDTYFFLEKTKLMGFLKGFFNKGDVVLVKGSRGMRMEEVVEEIKSQFKMQNPVADGSGR